MHSLLPRRLAVAVATAAIAAVALPAGAAPTPAATAPTVTVTGRTIKVVGAVDGGLGRTIGTDAPGDARGSGLGVDLASYTLAFPRKNVVEFGVALADLNPVSGHAPLGVVYDITATVGASELGLTATASPEADGGLAFAAQTCEPGTGVSQCTSTPVAGRFEDGTLIWEVATSGVGIKLSGGVVHVNPSASTATTGGLTATGGPIDAMSASVGGTAPTATILVDGVAATTGALHDKGYDVSAANVASGTHALAVRLCDGTTAEGACTDVDLGTVTIS